MRRRRLLRAVGILAGLALVQGVLLLAYRAVEQGRRAKAASFQYERVGAAPPLDLVLLSPDGSAKTLADFRGTPVLLHFWATWCLPCKAELPGLLELGRDLAREERVQLVALSLDTDWKVLSNFFNGPIPAEVLINGALSVSSYDVSGLPDTYLLDGDGLRRLRFGGARDWRSEAARRVLLDELEAMGVKR